MFAATSKPVFVGLDCEWNQHDGSHELTRTLQLAVLDRNAAVVDLNAMEVRYPKDFPERLKKALEMKNVVAVGSNVGIDVGRMQKLGVRINKWVNLGGMAKNLWRNIGSVGLDKLSESVFNVTIDKFG